MKKTLKYGKNLLAKILIVLCFLIAFIEVVLELLTLSLYSRLTNKLGINDMFAYKLLMWTQYEFDKYEEDNEEHDS